MGHQQEGLIKEISETTTFDSGFQKREFVITIPGQYPQDIKMEMLKEDCSKLDGFEVGEGVTADFNLRGNEYQGKYYVNIHCWKLAHGPGGPDKF